MSCGGKIYKGGDAIIAIPFKEEGYSDLSVRLYTDGEYSIERVESGCTIEDGKISMLIQSYELALLQDGIIFYTINYTIDDNQFSDTSNSTYVLKSPKAYSAQTPGDIYQEGFEAGLEACGHIEELIESGVSVSMSADTAVIMPSSGYIGMSKVNVSAAEYAQASYASGKTDGIAEQKAKLSATAFTNNGTFTREDGWSSVTVARNIRLGELATTPMPSELINTNWEKTFDSSSQLDGWSGVNLDMKEIINYGKSQQKALLASTAFTENATYTRADGWSAVTVNVTPPANTKIFYGYWYGSITFDNDYQFGTRASTRSDFFSTDMAYVFINSVGEDVLRDDSTLMVAGTYPLRIYVEMTMTNNVLSPYVLVRDATVTGVQIGFNSIEFQQQ